MTLEEIAGKPGVVPHLGEPRAFTTGPGRRAQHDPWFIRWPLILLAVAVLGLLIVVPVVNVFAQALAGGPQAYWQNLVADPDTRHSILLTLTVAPAAVVANIIFGVAAA